MTVAELITILNALPPTLSVSVATSDMQLLKSEDARDVMRVDLQHVNGKLDPIHRVIIRGMRNP